MLAFELQRLGGKFDAGTQVVTLQIRKLHQQVLKRVARHEVFEHGLDGVSQMSNGGLPVANLRVDGDARKKLVHGEKLQAGKESFKLMNAHWK